MAFDKAVFGRYFVTVLVTIIVVIIILWLYIAYCKKTYEKDPTKPCGICKLAKDVCPGCIEVKTSC